MSGPVQMGDGIDISKLLSLEILALAQWIRIEKSFIAKMAPAFSLDEICGNASKIRNISDFQMFLGYPAVVPR